MYVVRAGRWCQGERVYGGLGSGSREKVELLRLFSTFWENKKQKSPPSTFDCESKSLTAALTENVGLLVSLKNARGSSGVVILLWGSGETLLRNNNMAFL